jgi:pimeloyl-ACP methyl ester carboxylesterase
MAPRETRLEKQTKAEIPIWNEALCAVDLMLLHASPVCYGLGIPHGNGSAVVVIPGFLGSDRYLLQLHSWLERIGYRPYLSGITFNAECPNLLIQNRLNAIIDKAVAETGGKVDIIGHSLGGIMARSLAAQRPDDIASIVTLASPSRGNTYHAMVSRAAEVVRNRILEEHGPEILPHCYTYRCTCNFLNHLRCEMPPTVLETAIYTRDDGIVDWRSCRTGNPNVDVEVSGTHIGLVFNATVYATIATRLARVPSRTRRTQEDRGQRNVLHVLNRAKCI